MDFDLKTLLIRENLSFQILSTVTLFIISFFFIFWVGAFFEVDVFPLEDRATNITSFKISFFEKFVYSLIITLFTTLWFCLSLRGKKRIFSAISYGSLSATAFFTNSSSLLDTVTLISIPAIILFFAYHFSIKEVIKIQPNLFEGFFSIALLCISVSGLIISLISIPLNNELHVVIRNYSIDIFLLVSSFSPIFIFLLLIGSFIKLLSLKITKLKTNIQKYQIKSFNLKRNTKFQFLALFMLLSILVAILPHQPFINSENELVGADTITYEKWLSELQVINGDDFFNRVFVDQSFGDRSLSLILFSPLLTVFPENSYHVIDHIPVILSPLLVLTVFFLSREITLNDNIALLASFLTAISFQPLIGIYGGLYANMVALIFGYASFVFLFRFLKKPKSVSYLIFIILFVSMMLSHTYTWTFLSISIGIFLILSYRLKMYDKKIISLIFLIIVATFAFDLAKSIITDSPSGFERDFLITSGMIDFQNLFSFWSNLSHTSLVHLGGIFSNFLILSLCIYWLLRSDFREMPNLFMTVFLCMGILPMLFGGEVVLSRSLYNISFQIPAAIGLVYLTNLHRGKVLIIATSIWIFTISIQLVTNFI